jgi:endoglucanase
MNLIDKDTTTAAIVKLLNGLPLVTQTPSSPATSTPPVTTTPPVTIPVQTNSGVLPIDVKFYWEKNNQGDGITAKTGPLQFTDGILDTNVLLGWGKVNPDEWLYYEFSYTLSNVVISAIRMYDGEGVGAQNTSIFLQQDYNSQPELVATFNGSQYNAWQVVNLDKPKNAVKFLIHVPQGALIPNEIQFIGTYTLKNQAPVKVKNTLLSMMLGINGFEWNFEDANNQQSLNAVMAKNIVNMATMLRHYADWDKFEHVQGDYTFDATFSGGWNYDIIYQYLKDNGIDVLLDVKTIPEWLFKIFYPGLPYEAENRPAPLGSDLNDPKSYAIQAKLAFQIAARYGSKVVDSNLLGADTKPIGNWQGAYVRTKKSGMNLIKYMENENERDKWWKGSNGYQDPWMYAANLSAFYDGHKGALGAGYGVKNADPNMKVVMGGTAFAYPSYFEGMVEWFRINRGYKTDGTIDFPMDVINYHYYADGSGTSQGNNDAKVGCMPEGSDAATVAQAFAAFAQLYNLEVWVTETGYDDAAGSPISAPAIGSKSAAVVKADWNLRLALLYARNGIDRVFFYKTFDENPGSSNKFDTSGFINNDNTLKPTGFYFQQVKALTAGYKFVSSKVDNGVIVDTYSNNGKLMYAIVSPTSNNTVINYNLNLGSATQAVINTPQPTGATMATNTGKVNNHVLPLSVGETPVFILAQ